MRHAIKACWRSSALLASYLLCSCCAAACADAGEEPRSVTHITSAEMLVTDGRLFSPPSSTIDAGTLIGSWTHIDLPHHFSGALVPAQIAATGTSAPAAMMTTWYRTSLEGLLQPNKNAHLYLVHWQTAGQLAVYGDGHLLYRSIGTPAWNAIKHPALLVPLNQTAEAAPPKVILIRMDSLPGAGGAISSLYVGDTDALYSRYTVREWLENQLAFMCSAAFLAVGFFSLAVWIVRRHEPLYFLLFAISMLAALRRWYYFTGLEKLLISDQWFAWIAFNAVMWQIVALQFFMALLHQRRRPWLNRGLVWFAIITTPLTLPWSSTSSGIVPLNLMFILPFASAITMVTINCWDSWHSRSREARPLAIWMLVALLFAIHDSLYRKYQFNIEGFYLAPYATVGLFVAMMYIMFQRYVGAIGEVERVNAGLAQRLQTRETELAESHERLREIEHRQTLSQERQRLVQDMHDGLGSSLVSALRVVEHGRMDEAEVAQVLKGCIDDLKLAIDSMEPVDADLLLLLATLRFRLGPRLKSTGITLLWQVENVPALDWLDPKNALHILRILQETFTNIIKHTHATEIRVATGVENDYVIVKITDNGQGFAVESALKSGGKGLSNQMRRAEAIGAEIQWDSNNTGTCVTLRLPVKKLPLNKKSQFVTT
ncbi:MAG: sensor histidine kinase [Gallionella sp.]|jgi:signal transduction histidine kinase